MNNYEMWVAERREHRTTRKYLTVYRTLAFLGWVGFISSLMGAFQ